MGKNIGYILVYQFRKGFSHSQKVRFLQKFYGYTDHSNYNRYHYKREGILNKFRCYSPQKSILIVHKDDLEGLIKEAEEYLKIILKREVVLSIEDIRGWKRK